MDWTEFHSDLILAENISSQNFGLFARRCETVSCLHEKALQFLPPDSNNGIVLGGILQR